MAQSSEKSTEFLFNRDAVVALMVNSGFYRHRNLRNSLEQTYNENNSDSGWKKLTTASWEVLYYLIESYIADTIIGVTDVPYATNLSASTARRALRKLEQLGLAASIADDDDKRRTITRLSDQYRPVVDDFVKGYENGFAALIQRHDQQERVKVQQALERTREELEEHEALLLQANKLASLGHWVWDDLNDEYLYVSEENARLHGMSAEAFTGRKDINYFDDSFVHPDDREMYRTTVREADKQYGGYDVQHRIYTAEGEIRHVREISQPVLNEEGVLVRSIGTTQDITDYVTIEQELRKSEERLRHLLHLSTDLMSMFKPDGSRIFVNDCFCEFTGRSEVELLNGKAGDHFNPDEYEMFRDSVFMMTPKNPIIRHTYMMKRSDGEMRKVHWTDSALFDENGLLVEVHSAGRDVTNDRRSKTEDRRNRRL